MILQERSDVLEGDHGLPGVVEPLGPVFNAEYAVFEILAVGLDLGQIGRAHV